MKKSIHLLSASAASLLLMGVGTAQAQLDEIIVTAQKTEQNLQDVPIAVSVLPSEVIENKYANNIENLQTLVPSISFRKGSTNANSAISIRGIGTVSFSLAAEPAVSTVVDGVVLGRSGQAFTDLFDIERIEVLRGPQGTLYGKNAQAGVINIVTKRPSDTLEGFVEASFFEDNEYKVRGKISGPISDTVNGSLVMTKSEFDGHIFNTFNNQQVNGYERSGLRGMLEFLPSDDLDILLIYEHTESDDDCCADLEVLPSGRNPNSPAAPDSAGIVNGVADLDLDQRLVDHDLITQTIDETDAISAEVNKEFDNGHVLTSITAYRTWENTEIREGDFTSIGGSSDQPVFGVPFLLHDDGTRDWKQFSQELRIASPQDARFRYQVGFYYLDLDVEADFTRLASCQNNGGQNQPILDANPGLTCNANDLVSATGFFNNNFENYAFFGQADFDFTEAVSGFFGFRQTHDEVSFVYTRRNNDEFGRQGVGVRPAAPNSQFSAASGGFDNTFSNSTEEDNFSVKAGLRADLSELFQSDRNIGDVYFTFAQGYKGPGFNTFYNMGTNDALPIAAEESQSFEIGYKFNAGPLLLNIAAYSAEIDDFQANNFDNSTGVTITRLTNAGTVETQGVEVDAIWQATENLTLTAALAVNDATIKEFNCPIDQTTGQPPANCTSRSGLDLFFSPDVNYSLGFDYETPVSDTTDLFLNGNFSHVDDQQSLLPGNDGSISPNSPLPSYDQLDVNVGLSMYDDKYRVTLIGKNLTDDSFVTTFSGDGFRYQIPREADRYFGVSFRASLN
ncbi:TonB-dependent receptor [Parvularcula sp. IMCC14364]|uniref:TonB-dependent receptor n=1 Tax=Parvularcula sp. IMCC14364 TaxID=3067902 RepID=UPI0027423B68|nr:TonB-dependent receptor [Parvularcula sp. IMCC14364]